MVTDNTDYNEMANIMKVNKGLNGMGGMFYRNAEHRPKLTFKDGYTRDQKKWWDRNDIPRLPIVDSYK